MLGSLATLRVLTELLDPRAYGEFALGMALATAVNIVVLGPLGNGAARFYAMAREQSELEEYWTALRRLLMLATGLIALALLCTVLALGILGRSAWSGIVATSLLFATLTGHNFVLNSIQNSARRRTVVAFHDGIGPWFRLLGAAFLILIFGGKSVAAMAGYILAMVGILLSQRTFFKRTFLLNLNAHDRNLRPHEWERRIWSYCWPFAVWGVIGWTRFVSDRLAIQSYLTTADVGLYSALFQLGYYPTNILVGLVLQLTAPIAYERAGDASSAARMKSVYQFNLYITIAALLATLITALITWRFHDEIFALFVARRYSSVSAFLPLMILSGGIFGASQITSISLYSSSETRSLVFQKSTIMLLGILLNFAGAAVYGITGVVLGLLIFSLAHFMWALVISLHRAQVR